MNDYRLQYVIELNGGNFKAHEFLAGREKLYRKIIESTVQFRNWHGYSTQITSAYRPAGSHSFCTAIDMLIWKEWRKSQPTAMEIWRLITTWPWMGVGIYFDWEDGIGIHTDLCTPTQRQRPSRWLRAEGHYYYQAVINGKFYNKDKGMTTLESEIQKSTKNDRL